MQPGQAPNERRRSERISIVLKVMLITTREDGTKVKEQAESEVLSRHGALLRCKVRFPARSVVVLFNPRNGERIDARVIHESERNTDGFYRIAVEFAAASGRFWGVAFPDDNR